MNTEHAAFSVDHTSRYNISLTVRPDIAVLADREQNTKLLTYYQYSAPVPDTTVSHSPYPSE